MSADDAREDGLLLAVAEGDRESFAVLFSLFAPKVKTYLRRKGSSDGEAEDLVQETLLRVWRKARSFDPSRGTQAAWIFTIARNVQVDSVRRERHPEDLIDLCRPPPPPTPEETLIAADQRAELNRAVASLSKQQARVFRLAFAREGTLADVALGVGLEVPTVKSHLRRSVAKLREALASP
jgi:RNA polymerase sigma-70 factor, ECF subfamily